MTKTAKPKSKQPVDFIKSAGELTKDLAQLGHTPILVGGMALVTLGSTRVTKDFDFLIDKAAREQKTVVAVFYRHGFELVSKLDRNGDILRTIDNQNVASARLRIDRPKSAYFYNPSSGLRVDLLFDFPIPAMEVRARSTHKRIQSYSFYIANKEDLVRMKEIAAKDRGLANDLQDLEFLKKI